MSCEIPCPTGLAQNGNNSWLTYQNGQTSYCIRGTCGSNGFYQISNGNFLTPAKDPMLERSRDAAGSVVVGNPVDSSTTHTFVTSGGGLADSCPPQKIVFDDSGNLKYCSNMNTPNRYVPSISTGLLTLGPIDLRAPNVYDCMWNSTCAALKANDSCQAADVKYKQISTSLQGCFQGATSSCTHCSDNYYNNYNKNNPLVSTSSGTCTTPWTIPYYCRSWSETTDKYQVTCFSKNKENLVQQPYQQCMQNTQLRNAYLKASQSINTINYWRDIERKAMCVSNSQTETALRHYDTQLWHNVCDQVFGNFIKFWANYACGLTRDLHAGLSMTSTNGYANAAQQHFTDTWNNIRLLKAFTRLEGGGSTTLNSEMNKYQLYGCHYQVKQCNVANGDALVQLDQPIIRASSVINAACTDIDQAAVFTNFKNGLNPYGSLAAGAASIQERATTFTGTGSTSTPTCRVDFTARVRSAASAYAYTTFVNNNGLGYRASAISAVTYTNQTSYVGLNVQTTPEPSLATNTHITTSVFAILCIAFISVMY
jgi:hypothetical protein